MQPNQRDSGSQAVTANTTQPAANSSLTAANAPSIGVNPAPPAVTPAPPAVTPARAAVNRAPHAVFAAQARDAARQAAIHRRDIQEIWMSVYDQDHKELTPGKTLAAQIINNRSLMETGERYAPYRMLFLTVMGYLPELKSDVDLGRALAAALHWAREEGPERLLGGAFQAVSEVVNKPKVDKERLSMLVKLLAGMAPVATFEAVRAQFCREYDGDAATRIR
eukprot:101498_1